MNEFEFRQLHISPAGPLVVFVTAADMPSQGEQLLARLSEAGTPAVSLMEAKVPSWDDYLTPWPAAGILKGRVFGGHAAAFLEELLKELSKIPASTVSCNRKIFLAGYSLAGLFSLWAMTRSDIFSGCVCCSGSLWYPGFTEYMEEVLLGEAEGFHTEKEIYLSLGKKEPLTKHPVMSRVGEATEQIYEWLKRNPHVTRAVFEWNEDGHFNEPLERMTRGIRSTLRSGPRKTDVPRTSCALCATEAPKDGLL